MIELVIASAVYFAGMQNASADKARTSLRTCIKAASEQAKTQKIPLDGFSAFVRQQCTAQESGLKTAVWAIDSKNKVSRKQSESDAAMQIEDYLATAKDHYEMATVPR